jgi:hypothetical protein
VSPFDSDRDKSVPNVLERILTLARRGRAQYSRRAAVLSHWFWRNVSCDNEIGGPAPTKRRLARVSVTRRVRRRQQTYRSAGGRQSSTAIYALQRVARLSESDERDKQ